MRQLLPWLQQERIRKRLLNGLMLILLPLALFSTFRGASQLITDTDPCDLTPYWVSGVLARTGENPYTAYRENMAAVYSTVPDSPDFVTRCNVTMEERPPLTTPVHILLMLPFSLLSLRAAAVAWTLLQIASAMLIPVIMLSYNPKPVSWRIYVIGVLLVLAWSPTRMALSHGQIAPSIIMLAAMALLLLRRGYQGWAGLLMGIALTKFTLVGGLLLVMIIYRYYRAAGLAVLVQIAGFLLLSLLLGESPVVTVQSYLATLSGSADVQAGIISGVVSLDRWLQPLGFTPSIATLVALGIGAILGVTLVLPHYLDDLLDFRRKPGPRTMDDVHRFNLLIAAVIPLTLLFTYHRVYDLPFLFILIALLAGVRLPDEPTPAQQRRYLVWLGAMVIMAGVMLVPPSLFARFMTLEELPLTAVLILALAVALWLQHAYESLVAEPERPATNPAPDPAAVRQRHTPVR